MTNTPESPFWIVQTTKIKLSVLDRVRILFRGKLEVRTTLYVSKEVEVYDHLTKSNTYITPILGESTTKLKSGYGEKSVYEGT